MEYLFIKQILTMNVKQRKRYNIEIKVEKFLLYVYI